VSDGKLRHPLHRALLLSTTSPAPLCPRRRSALSTSSLSCPTPSPSPWPPLPPPSPSPKYKRRRDLPATATIVGCRLDAAREEAATISRHLDSAWEEDLSRRLTACRLRAPTQGRSTAACSHSGERARRRGGLRWRRHLPPPRWPSLHHHRPRFGAEERRGEEKM
jgi:hypothetical protein